MKLFYRFRFPEGWIGCNEIGCSTGTLIKKISERNTAIDKDIRIVGMDCEEDMIDQREKNVRLIGT